MSMSKLHPTLVSSPSCVSEELGVNQKGVNKKGLRSNNSLITNNFFLALYTSVSQSLGRGPVPDLGINYTGPREVLLQFVILVF